MATRYLVNGEYGAYVNNTDFWSETSGGTSGASLPTKDDDVVIDDNSGFDAYDILFVQASSSYTVMRCKDLTVSVTGSRQVTFYGYYDESSYSVPDVYIWCYGNCTLNSTCQNGHIWLFFRGTSAKQLTTGGALLWHLELVNDATLTLQDDLTHTLFTDNGGDISINDGTFDHNGQDVFVGTYYGAGGSIDFGSGTLTIAASLDVSYTTNDFGTCTIKAASTDGMQGPYGYACTLLFLDGTTIPHVEITKTNAGVYLSTDANPATVTFGSFAFTSGAHMYFSPGCTYEFSAAPVQNGDTDDLTYLDNLAPGLEENSIWSCASNVTIENLSIVRNDAEGGGTFRATGEDSVEDEYTTGWIIGDVVSSARPQLLLMMVG